MSTSRTLVRLDELLATMDEPQAAYVVRSRLDRSLLLVRRHIDELGAQDREAAVRVSRIVDSVEDSFRALRRRSEPFGEAWIAQLRATRAQIALLRNEVCTALGGH
jgi:hypothetical protein